MKRIFSILIVAVLLCSLAISASAAVGFYSYNGVELPRVPMEYVTNQEFYFYIFEESNGSYTLLTTSQPLYHSSSKTGAVKDATTGTYYVTNYDKTVWNEFGTFDVPGGVDISLNMVRLIWSSHDLYHWNSDVLYWSGDFDNYRDSLAGEYDDSYDGFWGWLKRIWDTLVSLPGKITHPIEEFLGSIFIPDTEELNAKFNSFLDELKMKFSFDTDFFESVLSGEQPVTDVEGDYNISGVGNFHLTFFESKFFVDGVTYFRPFIRGFIILLLALYNIKMLLGFIRQDAGIVSGTINPEDGKKKE